MKKIKRISSWIDSSFRFEPSLDDSNDCVVNVPKERRLQEQDVVLDEDISLFRDYASLGQRYHRETLLRIDQSERKRSVSFVEHCNIWEGTVLEIHEKTFTARLNDKAGKHKSRIVEMKKALVNSSDWGYFFNKGFEFEWVFQKVNINGTIKNRNQIRFTPMAHIMQSEIEQMVKREMELFSYLFEKDD